MNRRKHDKQPKHRAPAPGEVRFRSLDCDPSGVYDPMPAIEDILWPDSWLTADDAKAARNS